jgi:hypothetical protein
MKIIVILLFSIQCLAAQTVYYDNQTKLYGITNEFGKDILKPTYKEMRIFENGLSKFQDKEKWGLIGEKGIIVLKPIYDTEYDFGLLSEGLISVKKNNKCGYVNLKGEIKINFIYDWTEQFCNGIAFVKLNEKYNFVDFKGKLISDIWFDNFGINNGISYGMSADKVYEISLSGKKLMNSEFKMATRIYCDIATNFSDGFAIITRKSMTNGQWNGNYEKAIINEKGAELFHIDPNWRTIEGTMPCFQNGLIEFQVSDNQYILINKKGEIIKKMTEGVFPSFQNL